MLLLQNSFIVFVWKLRISISLHISESECFLCEDKIIQCIYFSQLSNYSSRPSNCQHTSRPNVA
jgi:hypothetical protein